MAASRITSLEHAAALIQDGSTVAIGGLMLYNKPMALVREIVRRGVKDLTVICGAPSTIDVDTLIGGGCVKTVIVQALTAERIGPVAPRFRDYAQRGELEIVDCDQGMINAGLRAAKFGVPSLPTVAGVGSDLARVAPNWLKEVKDPFTGQVLLQVRAMKPDFALVHAAISDEQGHAQQLGDQVNDDIVCAAADRIIVSAEQIVPSQIIQRAPSMTFSYSFKVAAVVEAPYGAHPCGTYGRYPWDGAHVKEYVAHARTQAGYDQFAERYIRPEGGLARYLDEIGWARLLSLRTHAGRFIELDESVDGSAAAVVAAVR